MKITAKLACCVVALAWMFNASAKEEVMSSSMAVDDEVSNSASAAEDSSEDAMKGNSSVMAKPAATGADSPATAAPAAEDVAVPTPPAPRMPVMAHTEKVDRTSVERKMEDRSNRAKKRTADAEKDVADRTQQSQANAVPQ